MNQDAEVIWSKLAPASDDLGVCCDGDGPRIGPIRLIKRTERGFEPRWAGELDFIIGKALNQRVEFASKMRGLMAISDALNRGDISHAMLVTQFLWLPALPDKQAFNRAIQADSLAKAGFSAGQPRDGQGRWSNSGGSDNETAVSGSTEVPSLPVTRVSTANVICTNCHAVVPIPPPVWLGPFDDLIFGPQHSRPNDGVSDDAHHAYEECHAMCLDQYGKGTLPGQGSNMPSRFRQCMRSCMEPKGYSY